jgi:hypothetical protein
MSTPCKICLLRGDYMETFSVYYPYHIVQKEQPVLMPD